MQLSKMLICGCILVSGCTSSNLHLVKEVDQARRERESLRIAYEAQQLRLKEAMNKLQVLEDQILSLRSKRSQISQNPSSFSHSPSSHPTSQPRSPKHLPLIRIKPIRLPSKGIDDQSNVPTLGLHNIDRYQSRAPNVKTLSQSSTRVSKGPVKPPDNAKYAPSLSIRPVPQTPLLGKKSSRSLNKEGEHASPLSKAPPTPLDRSSALLVSKKSSQFKSERDHSTPQVAPPSTKPSNPIYPTASVEQKIKPSSPSKSLDILKQDCSDNPNHQALQDFQTHLQTVPLHLREKTLYEYAFCLKQARQYQLSLKMFHRLIRTYPTGALLPQSLLKIGLIHLAEKRKRRGKLTLSRLVQLYPQTPAAQRAQDLLKSSSL